MRSPSAFKPPRFRPIKKHTRLFPILVGLSDGGVALVGKHKHFCGTKHRLQTCAGEERVETS